MTRQTLETTFLHLKFRVLSCRMQPPRISFQPVQLKARHDGWTAARQVRFIEELAATKSIARACRVVGMSRESAYKLRDRAESVQFRLAWKAALRPEFDRPCPRKPSRSLPSTVNATSSALSTLQTYLDGLRVEEQGLASRRKGNSCAS